MVCRSHSRYYVANTWHPPLVDEIAHRFRGEVYSFAAVVTLRGEVEWVGDEHGAILSRKCRRENSTESDV